ncbi:unnamed protein product [Kuraishia capsulata CBS 1993]|uniref:Succinate dehydrogenase assembly factor 2, mitochondrial n=1 Tax=Kuraishia capsulata CBS 1993 TaxID=1382522 RepID=W6MG44_9ASCO|nr:uncharacterized protein KUCA_T00000657001 [Kuraishia capsulata CBS 1993]CDK24691.1 unnamed protein product [Kuraishia capsulata CBS 1993]
MRFVTIPMRSSIQVARRTFHSSVLRANTEVVIKVEPIARPNEPVENKRRRLLYQSRKRGILESDLLLSTFADKYLATMTAEELEEYDKLLDEPDWDIYYWATRNFDVTPLPDKWRDSKILARLQELSENKENNVLRMPDLY